MIMKNPMNMDDLGVPLFQEIFICVQRSAHDLGHTANENQPLPGAHG